MAFGKLVILWRTDQRYKDSRLSAVPLRNYLQARITHTTIDSKRPGVDPKITDKFGTTSNYAIIEKIYEYLGPTDRLAEKKNQRWRTRKNETVY